MDPAAPPPAEIEITPERVRRLLQAQHPDLAGEPLRPIAAGWDNTVFRLGAALAVRLPRRAAAAPLLVNEQTWLPSLAAQLPVAVPAPVRLGRPAGDYPWRWSVVPWLNGATADLEPLASDQAASLAAFLDALHVPAPDDAPVNVHRGVPLGARRAAVEERMRRLERATTALDARVRARWTLALEATLDVPPTWIHGDLHARNVLVSAGRLSGVIDWGDLCRGDRATDLAAIWMLLGERRARASAMRACAGVSEATWARARGWAIFFGVVLSDAGHAGDRGLAAMGERTLRHVAEGP